MHILHINLATGFRGGERQTLLLIKSLTEQFSNIHQTLVIRKNSPLEERARGINNLNIIKINKPFLLHTLFIKPCNLIHAHEAKACHFAYWLNKRTGTPYIITRRMDRAPSNNWFTRQVYHRCTYLVSLSSAIEAIMLKRYPLLRHSIIPSMYASLPFDLASIEKIRNNYPNKILVGNIGALVKKHKGQHYIIKAAEKIEKSHPKIHFLILGDGRDSEELKKQAAGLNNITFLGFKTNIGDYYQAFDIFLFPSLQEGLGSALLDAMAASLPIIASEVGGIPDIIHHRKNGLLIPSKNSDAIVASILEYLNNKEMTQKLVQKARNEIKRFHPNVISQLYMDIYRSII